MIRQTMEQHVGCVHSQCDRCPASRPAEWREQLLAVTAAVAFFIGGIAVILLEGGLFTAVAVGLAAGLAAMLAANRVADAVEKRQAPLCARL